MQSQNHRNFDSNFGIQMTFSLRGEALKKIGIVELLSVFEEKKTKLTLNDDLFVCVELEMKYLLS